MSSSFDRSRLRTFWENGPKHHGSRSASATTRPSSAGTARASTIWSHLRWIRWSPACTSRMACGRQSSLGYRAMMVSVSDIAAMGGRALFRHCRAHATFERADHMWLLAFARGARGGGRGGGRRSLRAATWRAVRCRSRFPRRVLYAAGDAVGRVGATTGRYDFRDRPVGWCGGGVADWTGSECSDDLRSNGVTRRPCARLDRCVKRSAITPRPASMCRMACCKIVGHVCGGECCLRAEAGRKRCPDFLRRRVHSKTRLHGGDDYELCLHGPHKAVVRCLLRGDRADGRQERRRVCWTACRCRDGTGFRHF